MYIFGAKVKKLLVETKSNIKVSSGYVHVNCRVITARYYTTTIEVNPFEV